MASDKHIHTLHRYFLWANRQRDYFLQGVDDVEYSEDPDRNRLWVNTQFVNICYWMASLYIVVEGWQDLQLNDKKIDGLLESPYVADLKRFRNGVFHFHKKYYDDRFIDLFEGGGSVWASTLHKAFSRFFLDWFKTRGIKMAIDKDEDGVKTAYISFPSKHHK